MDPSSVIFDWLHEYTMAFDRVGVLSEICAAMPGDHTCEAACRRPVTRVKTPSTAAWALSSGGSTPVSSAVHPHGRGAKVPASFFIASAILFLSRSTSSTVTST